MMKFLKPIMILGGIALALVLLVEVVVRLLFPVPLEPPGHLRLTNEISGVKASVDFSYDSDRLRTINWGEKKVLEDGTRLLCLGGNATSAMLQSPADAWWGVLSRELGKATGRGVGAATLATVREGKLLPAVVAAEPILEKYKVDVIVVMFGFADAIAVPGDYAYNPGKAERLRVIEPAGFKYKLAKASHLLRIVRNGRLKKQQQQRWATLTKPNYYRDWLRVRARYFASRPGAERIVRTGDDPLREYLEGIEMAAALAKKHGAKLLVVGEPTLYKSSMAPPEAGRLTVLWHPTRPVQGEERDSGFRIRPLAVETELQRFATAAAAKCDELGVAWLDLQGVVPRFGDYFVTETYLTDRGSEVVAQKLLPMVGSALGVEVAKLPSESTK